LPGTIALISAMPRKVVNLKSTLPYHISARCLNREWFRIPLEEVWTIHCRYLFYLHHVFEMQIYSFVLMSNHFHLLAALPNKNLSEAMNYFMRETSRVISRSSGRINQVYGGPYHPTLIGSAHHFRHTYKYIYRNPVEAGLCPHVEDYAYSTLHGVLGGDHCTIPLMEDRLVFSEFGPEKCLRWLNSNYAEGHKEAIRQALRKAEFKLANQRHTNKPNELETISS
jgi:putative transposase